MQLHTNDLQKKTIRIIKTANNYNQEMVLTEHEPPIPGSHLRIKDFQQQKESKEDWGTTRVK